MNYELNFEGYPLDEELRDRLLLTCRKFVLEIGGKHRVEMAIKSVEGLVQGRVEVSLPDRRVSALVRRRDPVEALEAAIDALRDAMEIEFPYAPTGSD